MLDENAPECNCKTERYEEDFKTDSVPRCCAKQKLWLMLSNKYFTDVCFIVGGKSESQRIEAHKSVLSASSTVFEAMFSKNWSAKLNEIEVPDIEAPVFSCMLRFIYTDEIQLEGDSVLKILYAAKKYSILPLENLCSVFLKEQLSAENACSILTQARLFDQPLLVESCLEAIDESSEDAFISDGFTSVDLPALCSILERDTLRINELELFEAVVRWASAECGRKNLPINAENQKLVLEDAIFLIRFPLMSQKEFASSVLPFDLVSKDDVIDVFRYFSEIPNPSLVFSNTPRASKEPYVVSRFQNCCGKWGCGGHSDAIGFSFSQNVRLVGFVLYDSYNRSYGEYRVDITVKNEETKDVLYQNSTSHEGDGVSSMFRVLLKKSIKLTANTRYAVIAKNHGPDSYYGNGGQTVVSSDLGGGKKVEVTFHSTDYEDAWGRTDVNRGQIPEILFNW